MREAIKVRGETLSATVADLFQVALPHLSDNDLKTLSGHSMGVAYHLRNVKKMIGGLACIVADENESTGTFQDKDGIADLLFFMNDVLDYACTLHGLANDATSQLDMRSLGIVRKAA